MQKATEVISIPFFNQRHPPLYLFLVIPINLALRFNFLPCLFPQVFPPIFYLSLLLAISPFYFLLSRLFQALDYFLHFFTHD